MKSNFLEEMSDDTAARAALSELLPKWVDPWLLGDNYDAVAYLYVARGNDREVIIQADVSGRNYDDERVLTVLRQF